MKSVIFIRIMVLLTLVTLVVSCTPKERKTTQETSTSTKIKPKLNVVCLNLLPIVDSSWPVGSAVDNWNKSPEDRIKLSLNSTDCKTTVLVTVGIIDGGWGVTEYDKNGYRVRVTFSPDVPLEHRAHVTCHELGHVLGLPHRFTQDSCMNPDRLSTEMPSEADLQAAGKNYWQFTE